jgi:hypothetical protein
MMHKRSMLVFALSALMSISAYAESRVGAPGKARGSKRAAAERHRADGAKPTANAPQREARKAAKAKKAAVRALRSGNRAQEPSRPKDYSHDLQVGPGPEGPFGTALLSESFDSGIPAGWAVIDNAGTGVQWTNLAGCGETGNFTDGSGDVACVSSDQFGIAEFDTELRTPVIDLSTYIAPATLTFDSNYQNFANLDFLDVDVSTNGAAGPWTNLLTWNEDHGTFRATPGEPVNLDIASVVGQANVMFRFHYYDPNTADFDWYAQVDNVVVTATAGSGPPPPVEVPTLSEVGLGGLALLLAGAGFLVLRRQH